MTAKVPNFTRNVGAMFRLKGKTLVCLVMVGTLIGGPGGPALLAGEPPEEKLDCRVYDVKTSKLGLGLRVGSMLFSILFGAVSGPSASVTPQIFYESKSGIAWDKAVHSLIARYVELCNRYNAGLVTKSEYEARSREIETLYKEAMELEAKLFEAIRTRATDAEKDLDRALGQARSGTDLKRPGLDESVQRFSERVDQLDPIGQPLTPGRPCPAPDMLGAPGRNC